MPTILQSGAPWLRRGGRFSKGAQAVVVASADRNLVTGRALTYGSGTRGKAATPTGIGTPFAYNGVMITEVLPAIGTQTLVHAWVGVPQNAGANGDRNSAGFLIGSSTNDVGIAAKGQWYGYAWSDQWGALHDWSGQGDSGKVAPSGEVLPLGVPTVLVTIRRGTRIEMWRNGVLIAAPTKALISYAASAMVLGGFIDNNYWWASNQTVLAARLIADWSPQDVREFSADPIGAMLEPTPRFNWALIQAAEAPYAGVRRGYRAGGLWGALASSSRGYVASGTGRVLVPVARGYFSNGTRKDLPQ